MNRDHESYRSRVQDIRAEARSLIGRLRAERLAKSRFAPKADAPVTLPPPSKAEIDAWTGGLPVSPVAVPNMAPAPPVRVTKTAPLVRATKAAPSAILAKAEAASLGIAAPGKSASPKSASKKSVIKTKAPQSPVQTLAAFATPVPVAEAFVAETLLEAAAEPAPDAVKLIVAEKPAADRPKKGQVAARPRKVPALRKHKPAASALHDNLAIPGVLAGSDTETLPELAIMGADEPDTMASAPESAVTVLPATIKPPKAAAKERAKLPAGHGKIDPVKTDAVAASPSVSVLPGIGPGLVWRLEQSGYKTLEDVASARTEDLATKLGAVGKLVKIDRWIDFAKQATAA